MQAIGITVGEEIVVEISAIEEVIRALKEKRAIPVNAIRRTFCERDYVLEATGITSSVTMNGQYMIDGDIFIIRYF